MSNRNSEKPDWTLGKTINDVIDAKDRRAKTEPQLGGGTQLPIGGGYSNPGNEGGATFIDQAGGGSTTYTTLAGAINGANTTYTVSATNGYISGSLKVWLRGTMRAQGAAAQLWSETTPASGTFDFVTAPITGDWIIAEYRSL